MTYAIEGANTGTATAENVIITDAVPANTSYVSNSIRIGPLGGTYGTAAPQTDLADDGQAGGDAADYKHFQRGESNSVLGRRTCRGQRRDLFQVTVNEDVARRGCI